jgi:hypothetical protein
MKAVTPCLRETYLGHLAHSNVTWSHRVALAGSFDAFFDQRTERPSDVE